ncbi:MAG TPA: YeeE/YedE thiosulfate transporter family protein [Gemmatimonadaceae bacterium]|nr:YeeE/YedE thiosulfate transporter family protein [Gemmatimonadaceae bacterium]
MLWSWLRDPWPWYVTGPLIASFVPLLLWLGNRPLGMSVSLRAMCAAMIPGNVEFFRYDWKRTGLWNVALGFGILLGAIVAVTLLGGGATPAISPHTRQALSALGLAAPSGLVPSEVFTWRALLTLRGAICMLGGGFLVGFGASYAGGCTSGHGVMGLATLQLASLIAIVAIFAGGLLTTYFIVPLLF